MKCIPFFLMDDYKQMEKSSMVTKQVPRTISINSPICSYNRLHGTDIEKKRTNIRTKPKHQIQIR